MDELQQWEIFLLVKKNASIEELCDAIGNENTEEVKAICDSICEKFKDYNEIVDNMKKEVSFVDFPITLRELRLIHKAIYYIHFTLSISERAIRSDLINRMESIINSENCLNLF